MKHAVAAISLLLVLLLVLLDTERTSPGPLSTPHARAGLEGARSCERCHGSKAGELTEGCLACHETIGVQLAEGGGLHGSFEQALARDCAECHRDHLGAGFPLAGDLAFARAGTPGGVEEFEHRHVEYELVGRHAELGCAACHANAEVQPLPEGHVRFLGLVQECASCHEDPHEGAYGGGCAECHGQELAFERVAEFEHSREFPLHGSHAELACARCHPPGEYSIGNLREELRRSALGRDARDSCLECHSSMHDEGFLARVTERLGESRDATCERCHSAEHGAFRGPEVTLTAEQHGATGFFLRAPHDKASCETCHAPEEPFASAYPGRNPDDCAACHLDPHAGQFDDAAGRIDCLACHDRHRFEPTSFGIEQHARTSFPLRGAHELTGCEACHDDRRPFVEPGQRSVAGRVPASFRVFRGTPETCAECHEDPHRGQFADGAFAGATCADCHADTRFEPARFDLATHARTAFPLDGAHAAVACATCHDDAPVADGLLFRSAPSECAACHDDPHGGRFDRGDLPRAIDARETCARCHTTSGFRPVRSESFQHDSWTSWPLDGAHASVDCAACHVPGPEERARGDSFGRAAGTDCAACHADVHLGQLAVDGVTDCATCHAPDGAFRAVRFDHDGAAFALDETHATLDCGACHQAYPLPSGGQVVRYRPLGTTCQDCHEPSVGGGR